MSKCCQSLHSCAVPEQVISTPADGEAVIDAASSGHNTIKQVKTKEERADDEPPQKRQALGVDFTSLIKEEVFNSQQVPQT